MIRVRETLLKYKMLNVGDSVLVGLSGGADSVCLLLALSELKEEMGIKRLAAAHINHGIRKTAERDTYFAEELCKKNSIEFFCRYADIPALAAEKGLCEEEAGRIERYGFFEYLKETEGFNKIATAHNMNDQAETFLMRIISGSSLDGMECIKPVREDGVIRPLIETKRDMIEAYLKERNQSYMTDETNEDTAYRRNSLRHELIPLICEKYNPSFIETAANAVEAFSADREYISDMLSATELTNDCSRLSAMPDALLFRMLKRLVNKNLSRKSVLQLAGIVRANKNGASFDAGNGDCYRIQYGKLEKMNSGDMSYEYKLYPGRNYIKEIDAVFTVSEGKGTGKNIINVPSYENLAVRTRRAGDRIYLEKCGGRKKIKDIFIDRKIPLEERNKWPLVTLEGEIIWVTGIYKNEKKEIKYNIKAEWGK